MVGSWIEYVTVFIIGSAVGSFLNVVIYRVPKGMSTIRPGSACPQCKRPIKPWENIPLLSYICLRGRCAGCKKTISLRYPLIEAIMGGFAALLLSIYGWNSDLLFFGVLTAVLLALSAIDIDTYRLPNSIVLTGSILAVVLTIILRRDQLVDMLLGGVVGIGMLVLMGLIGSLLFRKPTLGMGDIKLAGMIGLYIGPHHTLGMFILGVFIGALSGGMLIILGKRKWGQKIPFGPYLAVGALISLFWGEILWGWYRSFVLY